MSHCHFYHCRIERLVTLNNRKVSNTIVEAISNVEVRNTTVEAISDVER